MGIRRLNPRHRAVPDWRSRFDRPYDEYRYAQPGEFFARPRPARPPVDYRRLGAWGQPGPFTGAGPQTDPLSDEQIYERACERLMRHGQVDARRIQVTVSGGEIRLDGSVSRPAERRMAEDSLWSIPGVQDVKNMLRVEPENPSRGPGSLGSHPPRGWRYKVESVETKRATRPATAEEGWSGERAEQTMLEAGLLPVTGGDEALADTPAWTIYTHSEESEASLHELEAGLEPAGSAAGEAVPVDAGKAISLTAGMQVVDREGAMLGRVKELRPDDFLLDRPLARDLYVPYSAVQSTDDRVVLSVRADEIGQQGWEQPEIM